MARKSRKLAYSGIYHVILRGVNRQSLFFDDSDRRKMLNCLKQYMEETQSVIFAYCLMDNHVHLLLQTHENLSLIVQKIASSYVYYHNHKYDRIGHLFQDRFRSEAVDAEQYFLIVFRYILRNPQKAGICPANQYPWSSWVELDGFPGFCSFETLIDLAGGIQNLKQFVLMENDDACLEAFTRYSLSDTEALRKAQNIIGAELLAGISDLPKTERNHLLAEMKKAGLSVRQISRITGLSRNIVQVGSHKAGNPPS